MNSKIRFIPYGKQTITEEDISAVTEVLRGPLITQGPTVGAFEKLISEKVTAKHAIAVNSATSALHIACLALGLGKNDILWTSPITFVASANCGLYCGATVDFVDIELETGLICTKELRKKLLKAKKDNKLPKVLIPVHLCGTSTNMREIGELAQEFGFKIIEDASHAIGGKFNGERVGNNRYSDATVFSFHPVKIITTAEGGLVTTNNTKLAKKMTELRSHGITKNPDDFEGIDCGPWHYEQQDLGFNYRMTDIQAGLGMSQLNRLDSIVEERNRLFKIYMSRLDNNHLDLLKIPTDVYSSLHLAVVLLKRDDREYHKKIFKGLREAGIGVQLHYEPVHLQPYYKKLGFKPGNFPKAETYARKAISLPLYPGLKPEEQEYVIDTLHNLLKG